MKDTKAVNVRMPIRLYEQVKKISDREHVSVSSLIFNILDKALRKPNVTILEIKEKDRFTLP